MKKNYIEKKRINTKSTNWVVLFCLFIFLMAGCSKKEEKTIEITEAKATPSPVSEVKSPEITPQKTPIIIEEKVESRLEKESAEGSISGIVIDRITSIPLATAFVSVRGASTLTTPSLNGRFTLPGLSPGDYQLIGYCESYSTITVRVHLNPGNNLKGIVLRLTPLASISGVVVDVNNHPIPEAKVYVSFGGRWGRRTRREGPSTTTDYSGTFTIYGIQPNRIFNLVAEHPDYSRTEKGVFRLRPGQREKGVIIVLERGGIVRGIVQTTERQPVDSAEVRLGEVRSEFMGGATFPSIMNALRSDLQVSSNPDGTFEFKNVTPGIYLAFARKEGFVYDFKDNIVVKSGQVTDGVILTLQKGAIFSGIVKNTNNEPVGNAMIRVLRFFGEKPQFDTTRTKQDGTFAFAGLLPGRYTVTIDAQGYPILQVNNQEVPAENVEFILKSGGILRGKVTEKETNLAVTKFTVNVTPEGRRGMRGFFGQGNRGASESFETETGEFEISGLGEGEYNVTVRADGYLSSTEQNVAIKEGKVTEIEIKLTKGIELTGEVLDAETNEPVAGARVSLVEGSTGVGFGGVRGARTGRSIATTTTDALGKFSMNNVPAGNFIVRATSENYIEGTEQIEISPEKENFVTIYLLSGGRITGQVLDAVTGQPVMGANVALPSSLSGFRRMFVQFAEGAITDSEGRFVLEPVSVGKHTLRISHNDYSTLTVADVEVFNGQTYDAGQLFLTKGGAIKGTVFGPGVEPISGAVIWANGPSGLRIATTNADGEYRIDRLEAGEYQVSVNSIPGRGSLFVRDTQMTQKSAVVEDGKTVEVDFIIEPGYTLSGMVTYRGEPARGWRVSYKRTSSDTPEGANISGTTTVDDQGAFAFKELDSGTYSLFVHRRGDINFFPITPVVEKSVTIVDEDVYEVLEIPESSIGGIVLDATTQQPVNGAMVTLVREGTQFSVEEIIVNRARRFRNTTTDSSGKFLFDTVEEGSWNLIAQHPYYSYELQRVELEAGEQKNDVEFRLQPGLTLKGTAIARSTGVGVGSLFLHIKDSVGNVIRSSYVSIDTSGNYIVTGLASGLYIIGGFAPNYAPLLNISIQISPELENTLNFEFLDGGTLDLTVLSETNKPVKNARADIILGDGTPLYYPATFENALSYQNITYTNDNGHLTHPHLPPGTHLLRISHPEFQTEERTIEIIEGQTTALTVKLESLGQ